MEGDEKPSPVMTPKMTFQSTPSAWRETKSKHIDFAIATISIHSLRMEGDIADHANYIIRNHFNPLPPHGGRLDLIRFHYPEKEIFQSTPSAWRETETFKSSQSLHIISIHSLRMEGDLHSAVEQGCSCGFQSTPSAWRETEFLPKIGLRIGISIHSLRMEGDKYCQGCQYGWIISIHSLRMEGDSGIAEVINTNKEFQSTPSAWRETEVPVQNGFPFAISIHSLRMEGDCFHGCTGSRTQAISIHSLRMEGDICWGRSAQKKILFQSTPSAWRETFAREAVHDTVNISIHSLRMEGDRSELTAARSVLISIHSLRMEGDWTHPSRRTARQYFNPLPPHGGRRLEIRLPESWCANFNPLPPHGGRLTAIENLVYAGTFQSTPSAWRETAGRSRTCCRSATFQSTPSAWRETSPLVLVSLGHKAISIHSLRMEGDG